MSGQTKITIIIPTLNEEQYLPLLLKDLSLQTDQNFKVIIVDAQSTDKTVQIAKKIIPQLSSCTIIQTNQQNVSSQRNLGAKNTSTPYLLFLDADTRLPKWFLSKLLKQILKKPSEAFTTFAIPDTEKISDKLLTSANNALSVGTAWIKKPYAFGACLGCTKAAFDSVGGFNTELSFQEDSDFLQRIVRLKLNFEIYPSPEYIFCMRRYTKEGTLNVILKTLPYTLKSFTKKASKNAKSTYPMRGGTYYE